MGANIEVDNTKEAGICTHCGTAFITEKVINKYNTLNSFNIANAVFQGGASESNLLARAKQFQNNGDYAKAREYANKVLDLNAKNQEALNILNLKYFTTLTRTQRVAGGGVVFRVIVEYEDNNYLLRTGTTITVQSSGKINKFIFVNTDFPKDCFLLSFVMKGETANIKIDTKWGYTITPIITGHNCESAKIIKL